ncbi:MAG: hypothetical protein ACU0B1_01425 [Thermohalobaculum sp.]
MLARYGCNLLRMVSVKLYIKVTKMEKSGGRKFLSLTKSSSGNLRHGVFQRFSGLKFERRLKVVLLSGTMGVLGSLAACAGSSGLPFGANIEKTAPAGSVAAQTAEACLPWDVACLLLLPVGTVPGGIPGPGDRGQDGGPGADDGGPGPGPGPGPGGDDGGPGPGASPGDGNNGVGNGDTGTNTGQAGLTEGDDSNPGEGRGFGRNGGGNAGGGNPPDGE